MSAASADSNYSFAPAQTMRLLGEMTKINESGKPDPLTFAALQSSYDFQQTQVVKFAESRNAAWVDFNAANVAFQRTVVTKIKDLAPKPLSVLTALRRDLGLSTQIEELEAQMFDNVRRIDI